MKRIVRFLANDVPSDLCEFFPMFSVLFLLAPEHVRGMAVGRFAHRTTNSVANEQALPAFSQARALSIHCHLGDSLLHRLSPSCVWFLVTL